MPKGDVCPLDGDSERENSFTAEFRSPPYRAAIPKEVGRCHHRPARRRGKPTSPSGSSLSIRSPTRYRGTPLRPQGGVWSPQASSRDCPWQNRRVANTRRCKVGMSMTGSSSSTPGRRCFPRTARIISASSPRLISAIRVVDSDAISATSPWGEWTSRGLLD